MYWVKQVFLIPRALSAIIFASIVAMATGHAMLINLHPNRLEQYISKALKNANH